MNEIPTAGLIYGEEEHHLDHIAPLCLILNIPLIVTEPQIEDLAKKFYPKITCLCLSYPEIGEHVVLNYFVIFSSLPRDLFDQIFSLAQHVVGKSLLNIWCPHGNSDKGYKSSFFEGLYREKIALVYGQKMIDTLVEKNVYSQLSRVIQVGNYRYELYKYLAPFYKTLFKKEILSKLPPKRLTLLYAPTWEDQDASCSLFDAFPTLLKSIPNHWNLIVKPHPNTLKRPLKIGRVKELVEKRPNIVFLENFPPIYPILDNIDAYLGDMSSIGYDCLPFNKPLFFLHKYQTDPKKDPSLFLSRCGEIITPHNLINIFSIIEKKMIKNNKALQKNYKEVNDYVFGEKKYLYQLRKEIEGTYTNYFKKYMAPA